MLLIEANGVEARRFWTEWTEWNERAFESCAAFFGENRLEEIGCKCIHGPVKKAHILSEIRRTVRANGGQPMGERAFYNETGIKRADWYGKFWARLSDAVKEAGYTPNEFPDEKQYSNDDMLSHYARLAQELGRLPTKGDLRLQKRRDSNAPNDKTYETRFGPKLRLVRQLSTYCSSGPEYADVLGWCQDYITNNGRDISVEPSTEGEIGYVYLMKMGKYCKIGRTNDFMRRGSEITTQLPERAHMMHFFQTDDPSGIEAYWHRRFAEKRREGEWFELDAKDIAAFKRRKKFM
jgi:hypothetical protein